MKKEFDYALYLTGNYKAVTRDGIDIIEINPAIHDFFIFRCKTMKNSWSVTSNGKYSLHRSDSRDVFLIDEEERKEIVSFPNF